MDIVFKNSKLEKEFNDARALCRNRGERQAKLIMRRLWEMSNSDNLEILRSMPGPRCHELKGNMKAHFSVDLDHPYRLIFVPNHNPSSSLPEGGIDWKKVTSVKILGVQDTHE